MLKPKMFAKIISQIKINFDSKINLDLTQVENRRKKKKKIKNGSKNYKNKQRNK